VAQLSSKVAKFALLAEAGAAAPAGRPAPPLDEEGLRGMVFEVLVKQLGHRPSEAAALIDKALGRRPDLTTPEELFEEIYRASEGRAGAGTGR
jgi:Holliday junction DNA helicase RuvA